MHHIAHPQLTGLQHYWVTAQSEYATDVLFTHRTALKSLYPRLISHGLHCFGAKEVMGFLGRKFTRHFQGELITDVLDLWHERIPGVRIKHRVGENWNNMYDNAGRELRIETVINNPNHFRVRKSVRRQGQSTTEWVPLRKGVAYLFRYRDISHSANSRYLDAFLTVLVWRRPPEKLAGMVARTRRGDVLHVLGSRVLLTLVAPIQTWVGTTGDVMRARSDSLRQTIMPLTARWLQAHRTVPEWTRVGTLWMTVTGLAVLTTSAGY